MKSSDGRGFIGVTKDKQGTSSAIIVIVKEDGVYKTAERCIVNTIDVEAVVNEKLNQYGISKLSVYTREGDI